MSSSINSSSFYSDVAARLVGELQNVIVSQSPPLSEVIRSIQEAQAQVFHLRGQEVTLVVGHKGAGKSTFINYMAGKEQVRKVVKGNAVVETINPLTPVSHGRPACTPYPRVYSFGTPAINFCDCPGFRDNRGSTIEIANAASLVQMAKISRKIKCIILCVDYMGARSERGEALEETIRATVDFLGNPELIRSVFLLFTHAKLDRDISASAAIEGLVDEARHGQSLKGLSTKHPFEFLVDFRNVGFYSPIDQERIGEAFVYDREMMKAKISGFKGIDEPHRYFKITISSDASRHVVSCLSSGQAVIMEHIRSKDANAAKLAEFLTSIHDLKELVGHNRDIVEWFNCFENLLLASVEGLGYKNDAIDYLRKVISVLPESNRYYQKFKESLEVLQRRLEEARKMSEERSRIAEQKAQNEAEAKANKISKEEAEKRQNALLDQENAIKAQENAMKEAKERAEIKENRTQKNWEKASNAAWVLGSLLGGIARGLLGGGLPETGAIKSRL